MSASESLDEVTTFQPARPPLRRSSEANFRATWNGSLKLVLAVATSPIRSVTVARADRSVSGSKVAARELWLSAWTARSRTPFESARNMVSNLARSASFASSTKWSRLTEASGRTFG